MSRIVMGSAEFTDEEIKTVNMVTSVDLVSDELAVDDFSFVVRSSSVPALTYGISVYYYEGTSLIGKFYGKKMTRLSATDYKIDCVSGIGLLGVKVHNGGLYTGTVGGDTVANVIDDIMDDGSGGSIVPYEIDTAVANTYVYGWLPRASKRENLHQLLFSYAISLIKNNDGSIRFTYLATPDSVSLGDDKVFLGGSVSIDDPATTVEVTEHSFSALDTDQTVTLFDNTDGIQPTAANTYVYFNDAPVHDISASSGLTVIESNPNYAVVSGLGILTGKKYTHTTQIIRRSVENYDAENVRTITNATLITPLNSENAVKRLLSYYSSKKTVSMDIVLENEKCGDQVSFTNPYGEADAGYITQLDVRSSSFMRATAKIITGYTAQGFGNYYTHYAVLTGTGTWTKPEDCGDHIRVYVVGGGNGGQGGMYGLTAGGAKGTGGLGGKFYSVDLDVSEISSVNYACGTGGAGGAKNGGQGGTGTDSVFGTYSSAIGSRSSIGFVNLLTGQIYGKAGLDGIKGGDGGTNGGAGQSVTFNGQTWSGGQPSPDTGYVGNSPPWVDAGGTKGGGGGAAYGGNGGNSYRMEQGGASGAEMFAYTGGNGANAANPAISTLGNGGNGGNGGGGAGVGGTHTAYWRRTLQEREYTYAYASTGVPGDGSAGGAGGDGVIIIYY